MPDDLRQHLEQAARQNGRSLNAEILLRLHASVDASDQPEADREDADLADRVAELEQRLAALEKLIADMRRR